MTTKLYENDSYIKKFTAKIIASDEKGTVLDKTAFFPKGGGQYGDTGYINGIRVKDTQIRDGIIYHITQQPLDIGTAECKLDWSVRYNRMQNHTGEHILSGVIHSKYGYNNVGFHLSDEEVTLDVDGKFTDEDIFWLEAQVNKIIDENRKVDVIYPSSKELSELEYRSKLDLTQGARIVTVEGVDMCACCAPHVSSASEVGLLKIVKYYNYKNGTRMHILCGDMARRDYTELSRMNTRVVNAASAKRYELCEVFDRMKSDISALKEELKNLRNSVIEEKINSQTEGKNVYCYFVRDFAIDDLIRLADMSVKTYPNALTAAFCGGDTEGYNFVIGGNDAKDRFADFKIKFNARGGGRDLYQGKVTAAKQKLEEYFNIMQNAEQTHAHGVGRSESGKTAPGFPEASLSSFGGSRQTPNEFKRL